MRDPKVERKVGDVLRDRTGQVVKVMTRGPGESWDLRLWRAAMRGATVLHVDSGPEGGEE